MEAPTGLLTKILSVLATIDKNLKSTILAAELICELLQKYTCMISIINSMAKSAIWD